MKDRVLGRVGAVGQLSGVALLETHKQAFHFLQLLLSYQRAENRLSGVTEENGNALLILSYSPL